MFISGALDTATRLMPLEHMRSHALQLTGPVIIDNCGHWVQQEQADLVNELLIDFLASIPRVP